MDTLFYQNPSSLDLTVAPDTATQILLLFNQPIASSAVCIRVAERARADVLCWVRGNGSDSSAMTIDLVHAGSNSVGTARIRAMLHGQSMNTVAGNVHIPKGSKDAESFFEYRAMLFDQARATATPALEIEEHPLKAGHAAAIGRIDEEQLFYLESRGISPDDASRLITAGFFTELLEMIVDRQKKEEISRLLGHRKS